MSSFGTARSDIRPSLQLLIPPGYKNRQYALKSGIILFTLLNAVFYENGQICHQASIALNPFITLISWLVVCDGSNIHSQTLTHT